MPKKLSRVKRTLLRPPHAKRAAHHHETMRAVLVGDDADRTLTVAETATPELRPEHVLVKVHATAVNRADLLQRRGHYPPPPGESEIIGLEAAGTVAELGDGVREREWRIGDRVMALLS